MIISDTIHISTTTKILVEWSVYMNQFAPKDRSQGLCKT